MVGKQKGSFSWNPFILRITWHLSHDTWDTAAYSPSSLD